MSNSTQLWNLERLDRVAGLAVAATGAPRVVGCPYGRAVEFDGVADSLMVGANPLAGLQQFTVEVVFRPDAGGLSEQRFLHMGQAEGDRVLFETRLTTAGDWFLDTFINSADQGCTLLNRDFLHPVGRWYHLAMSCDGGEQVNYVDGQLEQRGQIRYAPVDGGRTSIGVRLNQVCWFKGAIHQVRITPRVLQPADFALPQ